MHDCIIHFGMPKTGSTAIQFWLLRSLSDPRFHYLNIGRRGSGNLVAATFIGQPAQHHRNRKLALDEQALGAEQQALRDAFARSIAACPPGATAIFSAEALCNFSAADLARLHDYLGAQARQLRAVGYVRAPVSCMESVFQQRVKSGAGALELARNYPRYRERLQKFERLFGPQHVAYWPFAPQGFVAGCVVQDFCSRTGIAFRGESLPRANESLSLPALRLLFAYRRFGPGFGSGPAALRENGELRQCLKTLPGPRLRFHASLVAPLLESERADIAWMEERLGCSLAEELCEDPAAVRGEEDLLRIDADSLAWLAAQIGPEQPWRWRAGMPPEEVAAGVHRLRLALAQRSESAETGLAARATRGWQGLLRGIRRSRR